MARPASNLVHPQVHGARPHGYAVVSRLNRATADADPSRGLNVDAVRIGATTWCNDLHILYLDVAAVVYRNVDRLAVVRRYATDHHVAAPLHRYRLHHPNSTINHTNYNVYVYPSININIYYSCSGGAVGVPPSTRPELGAFRINGSSHDC